ncbi:type II toxin-antitoxin system VapC family toxin [Halorussus halobius]|uniref:type II toxin-antitoxin system VapC family toxin n=1 Tax=Halorussus halobius TaxID=1710537 RepID=UPI001092360B|nr:PIN domain-containing protein [Halorussus halobius]
MSERLFLDTNVFVAILDEEAEQATTARRLLNADYEFYTSLLNLLELRTVLVKHKQWEPERVEEIIDGVSERVEVFVHETSDVLATNQLQQETLLYPMDCLILAAAEDADAELVTFDSEVLDAGGTSPSELLD